MPELEVILPPEVTPVREAVRRAAVVAVVETNARRNGPSFDFTAFADELLAELNRNGWRVLPKTEEML